MMKFQFVNESEVLASIENENAEIKQALEDDKKYIEYINKLAPSNEKRYISFGLYGNKPKYLNGALRNIELAKTYYPGWVCRFYVTNDVSNENINQLKSSGAEVKQIPDGMGYSSGMFWRFMIANDPTVDRYIIRDVDSRLNARERWFRIVI